MATDSGGNQAVDFVWGNMPIQPDTNRTAGATLVAGTTPATTGVNAGWIVDVSQAGVVLDKALDSHNIVGYSYNGYPGYVPNSGVVVPNIVNDTLSAAGTAVQGAGLILGTNAGTGTNVLSQTPAAGASAALGTAVTTNTGTPIPNIVGDTFSAASSALTADGFTLGANTGTGSTVLTQTPAAGTYALPGTVVTTTS